VAKKRSFGDLFNRIAFDKRAEIDRGDGVTVGAWEEQFQVLAGYVHMRGGEAVMAGRLQGRHSQVMFVQASDQTRLVTTEWQVRDVRSGIAYAVRDITPSDDRLWLDFLCESGVATG